MCLEREMPRLEETDVRVCAITLESCCTGRKKERVIFAPDREEWWLVLAEVVLERRIQRHIASVVAEQVELDLISGRSQQVIVVERVAVRRDRSAIRYTVRVLPERRFWG